MNFQVMRMAGEYWGVFIVNPNDPQDKYLLTTPLSQSDAEYFRGEFARIAAETKNETGQEPDWRSPLLTNRRKIRLLD